MGLPKADAPIPFESFPDSEGIKTAEIPLYAYLQLFESFPDSEGIKTQITNLR